jgi:hypothetical protein
MTPAESEHASTHTSTTFPPSSPPAPHARVRQEEELVFPFALPSPQAIIEGPMNNAMPSAWLKVVSALWFFFCHPLVFLHRSTVCFCFVNLADPSPHAAQRALSSPS